MPDTAITPPPPVIAWATTPAALTPWVSTLGAPVMVMSWADPAPPCWPSRALMLPPEAWVAIEAKPPPPPTDCTSTPSELAPEVWMTALPR
ncbi:hypothetical protein [Tistrella mobilis]|uniref:hypothetical protein n=1 Tax=Tistrella mobilis TaxID=171437 RepID=UPI0005A1324E|nr:hypothetical protein [Tistrella mobilis]